LTDLKTNPAYVLQNAVLIVSVVVLCLTFALGYPLAIQPLWLVFVISINVYAFFKFVKTGSEEEYRYVWLIPLSIGSIWQMFASQSVDVSFALFPVSAVIVFGLSYRNAIKSAICLNLLVFAALAGRYVTAPFSISFLFFSGLILCLFYAHNRDFQKALGKYESTIKMIEESREQAAKSLTFVETPKLDPASQLLKSGQYESKLTDIMQIIVNIIHNTLNAHSCVLFRYDEKENNFKIQALKSSANNFDVNAVIEPESQSFLSFVIKNKKKFKHAHFYKLGKRLEFYNSMERINTCLIQPIKTKNALDLLGLIVVDSKATYAFTENEEKAIADFADISAQLIVTHRSYLSNDLYADYMCGYYKAVKEMILARQNYQTLLKKFIEISNMIKQSDELAVVVSLKDDLLSIQGAQNNYLEQMLGETIEAGSICSDVLGSEKDLLVFSYDDIRKSGKYVFFQGELKIGMNSMMLVKLPMQENTHGALFLGSKRKNHYNKLDMNAFTTLAAQFGVALENALHLEESRKLANTDGLTNLVNHRCFQETLATLTDYAQNNDAIFSLLLLDIDHFKTFNDTYGHQAGDGVLKHLASLLKKSVDSKDVVARYGGEEFVVILMNSDLKAAKKSAEKIRKTCNRQKIRIGSDILNITVSIGISQFSEHACHPADLISMADAALYRAKNLGRNRVEIASEQ
jgi:diguanylate cyclase (GGDEF)-like protein